MDAEAPAELGNLAMFPEHRRGAALDAACEPNLLLGNPPSPPYPYLRTWLPSLTIGAGLAGVHFAASPPSEARWESRNDFDEGIRDGLKGGSRAERDRAETASDVLLLTSALALLGDEWWLREEFPLLRSVGADSSWLLATLLLTESTKVTAGRERPYVRPCRSNDDYVESCGGGRDRNASFFSGHTSLTATSAGLLCARHAARSAPGFVDWLVCGGAATASVTTGLLRITAEKHYASDVVVGWAAGALLGYVLPSWFDYNRASDGEARSSLVPVVGDDRVGVQYSWLY